MSNLLENKVTTQHLVEDVNLNANGSDANKWTGWQVNGHRVSVSKVEAVVNSTRAVVDFYGYAGRERNVGNI